MLSPSRREGSYKSGRISRFRSNYFQQRIRNARSFKRQPKILPEARTNVSLAVFSRRSRILWSIAATLVVGAFLFVALGDKFIVKNFTITGTSTLPEDTVKEWLLELKEAKFYKIFPGNHYFAVNKDRIERLLSQKTVYFKRISKMEKKLPDTVSLEVEERIPKVIWQNSDSYFLLDTEGFVLEKVPASFVNSTTTRESYLSVSEGSKNAIVTGNYYATDKIGFVTNLADRWRDRLEYKITVVHVPDAASSDVFINTDLGFTVYFDSRQDTSHQMEIFVRILRQIVASNRISNLAYVDVRLPAIAYYCFRGEPCGALETEDEVLDEATEAQ